MEFQFLHTINTYLHHHPYMGIGIAFLVSFIESLAVIGAIVPGSVTMTVIGVLIGSGVMPGAITMIAAILGAVAGDFLSYWVGKHYKERLNMIWPFYKHPHWLTVGKDFFHKHGGKSVVLGRFFGPVRSVVPLVAGLMQMSTMRFLLATFPAAILWAIVYISPGILVGALSLELPASTATKFILIVLSLVAFSWVIFVLMHFFFKTIATLFERLMMKLWGTLSAHKTTQWAVRILSGGQHKNAHQQLTLLVFASLFLCLFLVVFHSVKVHGYIAQFNQPVFELLRSLRTPTGDTVMLIITFLGDRVVQLGAVALILIGLCCRKHWCAALHLLGVVLIAGAASEIFKMFYYSPRPTGLVHQSLSSSFPSGHTILSVSSFGFLAVLLAYNQPSHRRKFAYFTAGFLIIAVGLSRLYLGAHWLTDVLASLCLGLAYVLLGTISYKRWATHPVSAKFLSFITVGAFLVVGLVYEATHFRKAQENYTLYWSTFTTNTKTWWEHRNPEVPLFVISRLGEPRDVLNVQWLGSLEEIKKILLMRGWVIQAAHLNFKGTLKRLSPKMNPQKLPLLPTLYQNQAPVLVFTKLDTQNNFLLLFLWKSNVTLENTSQMLWLGSLHYFVPKPNKKRPVSLTPQQIYQLYKKAYTLFIQDLKGLEWKTDQVPLERQPMIMRSLFWDGKLLLIREK